MTELRVLREEVSKGRHRDLRALAVKLGRTETALLSAVNNHGMQALRMETQERPGFACQRCGASSMWDELPSDDPMALLNELKRWKQEHMVCKEGK